MSTFIKSKKYIGIVYNLLSNKDKSYYITYKFNNKYKRIHIGKQSEGINEAFCYQKRNEIINNLKFGDDVPVVNTKRKIITFDSIAQKFLSYNEIHSKDFKNHISRYNNHIKEILGNKSIHAITNEDIENLQKIKLKSLSPKTVNHIIQLVGTIYNYNINNKYIKCDNPVLHVKKLKINNERLRYLNTQEIKLLLDYIKDDKQLFLFVKIALQTGARLNTLINIKKKDIDLKNNIISLEDYKNNSSYKGFLQNDTIELLKSRLKDLKSNDLIFLYHTKAKNLQTYISKKLLPILNKLFNSELEKNDIQNRAVIHTLRHTFASHLAINGTPIFTIQKLMNHKDINMTLRYAKLAPDSGKDFVNKLYK
jgi:integrase